MLSRRAVTQGLTLLAVPSGFLVSAQADTSLAARLKEPGPLPERIIGQTNAPVTIVEYASLSCGFCVKFHLETWPALRAKYVETGKVSFIIREFPLDPFAMAGFMLARCSDDKWYEIFDTLYRTKEEWAHAQQPAEAMIKVLAPLGVTQESFNACVSRNDLFKSVLEVRERGQKAFGVNATPTFFINGARHQGALTLAQFDAILEPLLARARR